MNSNSNNQIKILESQVRESFGRVVFSHKTHEKCADIYSARLAKIKVSEIILSSITTTSLLTSIFGDQKIGIVIGAISSTIVLGITIYTKDYDLGKLSKSHSDIAQKIWNIREMYISLIADIKSNTLSIGEIKNERNKLQEMLDEVYRNAPRTNSLAYELASKALNENSQVNQGEEMTFTDDEIDRFLPNDLRRNSSSNS